MIYDKLEAAVMLQWMTKTLMTMTMVSMKGFCVIFFFRISHYIVNILRTFLFGGRASSGMAEKHPGDHRTLACLGLPFQENLGREPSFGISWLKGDGEGEEFPGKSVKSCIQALKAFNIQTVHANQILYHEENVHTWDHFSFA